MLNFKGYFLIMRIVLVQKLEEINTIFLTFREAYMAGRGLIVITDLKTI